MEDVITFNKSLMQRLSEYNEIFPEENMSLWEIEKHWRYCLQLEMDVNGWQAVWKIPRLKCQSFNISFPTVVLVLVLDVDIQHFKATVRIMAVQDDIVIPGKHKVPLIELWPTKEQDKSVALNLYKTADILDSLRFFYLYIYMPWDRDNDSQNWKQEYLEKRLRLHYDLKNEVIPKSVAIHVESLLSEARRLAAKRNVIEAYLAAVRDRKNDNDTSDKSNDLKEIHVRLHEIRSEIEIYEEPSLRDVFINRHLEANNTLEKDPKNWAIISKGTIENTISFFQRIKEMYPSSAIVVNPSLDIGSRRDKFFLSESKHDVHSSVHLEHGGALIGAGDKTKTILIANIENVMFNFTGGEASIKNVTIDAKVSHCAVLVSKGKAVFKNCQIIGDPANSVHQGIIVLKNAQLEMINCEIEGFFTSIVCNSGSKITLKNCKITSTEIGLKAFDNCNVTLVNVDISNCNQYGIAMETRECNKQKTGGYDILKTDFGFILENVKGQSNGLGNATVYSKPKLNPVEDLFSNPDLDPTIIESDSENMECDQYRL